MLLLDVLSQHLIQGLLYFQEFQDQLLSGKHSHQNLLDKYILIHKQPLLLTVHLLNFLEFGRDQFHNASNLFRFTD
jgi:hypothetical protein